MKKLQKEFSQKAITTLRETMPAILPAIKTKNEIKFEQKSEMLFTDAAKHYFRKLRQGGKSEKLLNAKNSYKNHILPYFENYKIRDISSDTLKNLKKKNIMRDIRYLQLQVM